MSNNANTTSNDNPTITQQLSSIFNNTMNTISSAAKSTGEAISSAASSTGKAMSSAASSTGKAMSSAASSTGKAMSSAAKSTGEAMSSAAKSTGEAMSSAASSTGKAMSSVAKSTGEAMSSAASSTGKAMSSAANIAKITSQDLSKDFSESSKIAGEILTEMKTPTRNYVVYSLITFLVIMMFIIFYDVKLPTSTTTKSQQQAIGDVFIILFFSLLVFGLSIMFLPNMKELKALFEQIHGVTYVILYTIFAILFYTMMPSDTINQYAYIINPIMFLLCVFAFYKSANDDYIDTFNINYERIKMLILFFCLITLTITFYNINPGDAAEKYFGYSMLLTIIVSVFAFLYIIVLLTLSGDEGMKKANVLSNFSSFGVYGVIGFVIFLIIVTTLISSDKDQFFSNKEKASGVMILLLIVCILWVTLLGANLFDGSSNTSDTLSKIKFYKNGLLGLFGLVVSGLIIYWITYNIENLSSSNSSVRSFVLNMLLVTTILGLIYKTIYVQLPAGNARKNAFFDLILKTVLYIPCLFGGMFDWVGKKAVGEYNASSAGSIMMLVLSILLVIFYFKTPSLLNLISTQGGNQLVNRPVYTDVEYNLGSYQDLNNGSDTYQYQYAISCWVYLDSAPPNLNPNYTRYTSLLNFGGKPAILYNPSKNTLMVTMKQKDLKDVTKNKLIDFDDNGNRILYIKKNVLLQKWNNIIINYNGGTMDIFLNGELVKSSIEVVPYYTYDNLVIGENEGIKGGISNVVYFRHSLDYTNIYLLYNSVKDRNPPILNDSNETVLIKQ